MFAMIDLYTSTMPNRISTIVDRSANDFEVFESGLPLSLRDKSKVDGMPAQALPTMALMSFIKRDW